MSTLDANVHKTKLASRSERLVIGGVWLLAVILVSIAAYLGWRVGTSQAASPEIPEQNSQVVDLPTSQDSPIVLPEFETGFALQSISRLAEPHTIIPSRPRQEVITYTVSSGDAVFGIAQKFNIQPETVLWANYDQLNDNPDMLTPGMVLNIPPVNGVYYHWQEGDTLESIANQFKAEVDDILSFPGNHIDLINPIIETNSNLMIPGGEREFKSWIVPTIARDNAGVSKSVYGAGACAGPFEGAYGTGGFVWPTVNQVLSGNDYWSGHLGIDIAGAVGDAVFASDSGVVVFAGAATGGYGSMIMIDHGTGYQTLYAHLSSVRVRCGQSVLQGGYIGAVGSTGNSTGPHLHFEVRYLGGFVSPWYVLP
jgi:murein DD-endopeptidase MepM/ murein hydrolase activator NlpD